MYRFLRKTTTSLTFLSLSLQAVPLAADSFPLVTDQERALTAVPEFVTSP